MNSPLHFTGITWKEQRLCAKVSAIETGVEKEKNFLDSLQNLNPRDAEKQLEKITQEEKPNQREYWVEALSGLSTEVQEMIRQNLEYLSSKTNNVVTKSALRLAQEATEEALGKKEVPNETEGDSAESVEQTGGSTTSTDEPPKSFTEKVTGMFTEMGEDFHEKRYWTLAAKVGTGFFGFALIRYLYNRIYKAFRGEKKQSWISKGLRGLLTISGLGAGIALAKLGIDKWNGSLFGSLLGGKKKKNDPNSSPGPVAKTFNAVSGGVQGAGGAILDTASKGVDIATKDAKFWVELFQQEDLGDAMQYVADEGFTLAYENGKFILYDLGWNAIASPVLSLERCVEWAYTGERPKDFYAIWGSAGASYFMGKNAFRGNWRAFLPLRLKDTVCNVIKIGLGPVDFVVDAFRTANIATQVGGIDAIKIRYLKYNIAGKMRHWMGRRVWSTWGQGEASVLSDIDQAVRFSEDVTLMNRFSRSRNGFGYLFTDDEVRTVNQMLESIAENIRDYTLKMKVTESTPTILRELKKISHVTKTSEYWDAFEKIRSKVLQTPDNAALPAVENATNADGLASTRQVNPEGGGNPRNTVRTEGPEQPATVEQPGRYRAAVGDGVSRNGALPKPESTAAPSTVERPQLRVVDSKGIVTNAVDGAVVGSISSVSESVEPAFALEGEFASLRSKFTGSALTTFDEASQQAKLLGLANSADECVMLFTENHAVIDLLARGNTEINTALQTVARGAKSGEAIMKVQRTAAYIFELGSKARGAMLAPRVINEVTRLPGARGLLFAKIFRMMPASAMESEKGVAYAARQLRCVLAHPVLVGGVVALATATLVFDYIEHKDMRNHISAAKEKIGRIMESAKLPNGSPAFKKVVKGESIIYAHTRSKLEFDLTSTFNEGFESLDDASITKLGAAAGFIAGTLLELSYGIGPVGLILGGVVLGVRGLASIQDQMNKGDVLVGMPLPILAIMGFGGAVKGSEYQWLEWSSNHMAGVSDLDRQKIKKRDYTTIFFQELAEISESKVFPEIASDVLGGMDIFEFLSDDGDFFKHDFPKVIAPYISMRLVEEASKNSTLTWEQLRDQNIKTRTNEWMQSIGLYAENVPDEVIREIMHEAVLLERNHLIEVRRHMERIERENEAMELRRIWSAHGQIESPERIRQSAEHQIKQEYLRDEMTGESKEKLNGLPLSAYGSERYQGSHASQISTIIGTAYKRMNNELWTTGVPAAGKNSPAVAGNIAKSMLPLVGIFPATNMVIDSIQSSTAPSNLGDIARKKGLFDIPLPDGLFPEEINRTVDLRNIHKLTIEKGQIAPQMDAKKAYEHVVSERKRVVDFVEKGGRSYLESSFPEEKYKALRDYAKLLQSYPQYDPDSRVRNSITALPPQGWKLYHDTENAHETRQRCMDELAHQERAMSDRYFEYFPETLTEKTAKPTAVKLASGSETDIYGSPVIEADRVSSEGLKLGAENIAHLSATALMTPSADGTYYTRRGDDDRYFVQENGTIYRIPNEESEKPTIFAVNTEKKIWEWREATPMDRLHDINPRYKREMYVRTKDGAVTRFEAIGKQGSFPIVGGTLTYEDKAGRIMWKLQSSENSEGRYEIFKKNHLGIEQPGQIVEVQAIPPINLALNPELESFFFPDRLFEMKVILHDDSILTISSRVPEERESIKQYVLLEPKRGKYKRRVLKDNHWISEPDVRETIGCLCTVNAASRAKIKSIEMKPLFSNVKGETWKIQIRNVEMKNEQLAKKAS